MNGYSEQNTLFRGIHTESASQAKALAGVRQTNSHMLSGARLSCANILTNLTHISQTSPPISPTLSHSPTLPFSPSISLIDR